MDYNNYIEALLALRRNFETKIDNEIEECMRGRGDSNRLKETLEYLISDSAVLRGKYIDEETKQRNRT